MSNLLTKQEKKSVEREYYTRVLAVALTLLFFSGVLSIAELLPSFFYSSVAHALKKTELEKMTESEQTSEEITSTLKRIDTITSFIDKDKGESPLVTELVKEALIARPQGVAISRLSFETSGNSKMLVISGVAAKRADLITFVSNLGKRPGFTSTDVPAENLARAESIPFTVRITGDF